MTANQKTVFLLLFSIAAVCYIKLAFENKRQSTQTVVQETHCPAANQGSPQHALIKTKDAFSRDPAPFMAESGGYILDKAGHIVVSRLDERVMQHIAAALNGQYVHGYAGENVSDSGVQKTAAPGNLRQMRKKRWNERFRYIIGFAVLLFLMELFIRR